MSNPIRYNRQQALGLVNQAFADLPDAPQMKDQKLDELVRQLYKMQPGPLYGFIRPIADAKPSPSVSTRTVADIIGACDTGLACGLSEQLIQKLNRMVNNPVLVELKHDLIKVEGDQINPYLQSAAANSLILAVKERGSTLLINSCLRTTVQQHIIRVQYERGLCGITAAAAPGRSNHEQGLAIDIEDPYGWQPYLERHGWAKLGEWDDMHFDYWQGRNDIAKLQIYAFQQLWNAYNPKDLIAVDGSYGPTTAARILKSPVDGWSGSPPKKA